MKIAPILLALVAGAGIGWFARGKYSPPSTERIAERRDDTPGTGTKTGSGEPGTKPGGGATAPGAGTGAGPGNRAPGSGSNAAPDQSGDEAGADTAKKDKPDPLVEMLETMRTQWKGFATMQAKQKVKGLLEGLGFDAETAAEIEAAILADVDRQMDRAIDMMIGKEDIDRAAFATFLGLPPDLSTELSGKLGTFLSDEDVGVVRERVKGAYKKQLVDMADMQIGMMSIPNLSGQQKDQLREALTGRDMMTEQFVQFAHLTRDRDRLKKALADDKSIDAAMRANFAPSRDRLQAILTPEQFKSYEKYEQSMISMARTQMKMMQGLFTEESDDSGK
ncbi:MAG: hypothetical protein OER88_00200 [Planctomycetota bacterium]|nr:hypothetical protein [Planctomycetota bacterium]